MLGLLLLLPRSLYDWWTELWPDLLIHPNLSENGQTVPESRHFARSNETGPKTTPSTGFSTHVIYLNVDHLPDHIAGVKDRQTPVNCLCNFLSATNTMDFTFILHCW